MKKVFVFLLVLVLLIVSCNNDTTKVFKVRFYSEDGEVIAIREVIEGSKVQKLEWNNSCNHNNHGIFLYWSQDKEKEYDFKSAIKGDIDLYPIFDLVKHCISFDNVVIDSSFVTTYYSGVEVLLPIVESEGNTFLSWQSDDVEIKNGKFIMPTKDVTIKALWEKNTYSLSFDIEELTSINAKYQETVILPTVDCVKEWKDENGKIYIPGSTFTMPAYDLTLYAVYDNFYNLTINDKTYTLSEGSDLSTYLSEPIKKGYTFVRWDNLPEDNKMPNKDIVITPIFEANSYNVIFKDGDSIIKTITVKTDDTILEQQKPTKEGFVFSHWEKDGKEFSLPSIMTGEDIILVARWKEIISSKYSLIIKVGETTEIKEYDAGSKVVLTTPKAPEGHSFSSWSSSDVTVIENSFTMPNKDVTITAVFNKNSYTVKYQNDDNEKSITVLYGEKVPLEGLFTKDGYDFIGWSLENSIVSELLMPDYDIILIAKWQKRTYKIISYKFEGVEIPSPYESDGKKYFSVKANPSEKIYIDKTKLKKDGYDLIGFEKTTGTTVNYSSSSLSYFTVGERDIVIEGSYEGLIHKLYLNSNYDGNDSNKYEKNIRTGEIIGEYKRNRNGYVLVGWAYDKEGTNMCSPTDKMPNSDLTLYAIWREKESYQITFFSEVDGFKMNSLTFKEGSTVNIKDFNQPAITGYYAKGFALSDKTINIVDEKFTMPSKNIEIMALYEKQQLSLIYKIGDTSSSINVPYGDLIKDYLDKIEINKEIGKSYIWKVYKSGSSEKLTNQVMNGSINRVELDVSYTEYELNLVKPNGSIETKKYYYNNDISSYLNQIQNNLKTDYSEFDEWLFEDGTPFNSTKMPNSDLTLYAKIKDRYYTFTFIDTSGKNDSISLNLKLGDDFPEINFENNGYYIHSWNSRNYVNIIFPNTVTDKFIGQYENDNIFKTNWQQKATAKVTYSFGNSTVTKDVSMGDNILSEKYVSDIVGSIDGNTQQLEGEINSQWYLKYNAIEDISVNLEIKPKEYIVTYQAYTDSSKTTMITISSQKVRYGSTIPPIYMRDREGYTYKLIDVPSTMPSQHIVVRGYYEPLPGKVIVHESESINMVSGNPKYTVLDIEKGKVPTLPEAPKKEGKSFVMYLTKKGVGERYDIFSGDDARESLELYPIYSDYEFALDRETKSASFVKVVDPYAKTEVEIPANIYMYSVNSIANNAFFKGSIKENDEWIDVDNCGLIKKVIIPSSIKSVGEKAFYKTFIESVIFKDGSNNVSFGYGAFMYSEKLKELKMPSTYSLDGASIFHGCSSLESFIVPSFIKIIPSQTFALSGINEIIISEGVEEVGEEAFYMTENLTSVTFPSTMKKIGDYAFSGDVWGRSHSPINNIKFNEGLEEIGVCAFRNISATEIKTPNSVKRIGSGAFSDCENLETLYLGKNLEQIYDGYDENGIVDAGGSIIISSDSLRTVYCNFYNWPKNFYSTISSIQDMKVGIEYNHNYSL